MHDALNLVGRLNVQTRLATGVDLPVLAHIHKIAYSRRHFTALLPERTLACMYGHYLADGVEICLATSGDDILGFAVYGTYLPERFAAFKKAAALDIFLTSLRHPVIATCKLLNAVLVRLSAKQVPAPANFLL